MIVQTIRSTIARYLNKLDEDFIVQKKLINTYSPLIFDVGANVGQTTDKYLRLFSNPVIHAFEPFEEVANKFHNRFSSKSNVILNKFALSNKEGTATFHLNKCHYTNSLLPTSTHPDEFNSLANNQCRTESKILIKTVTIDNYVEKMKINTLEILKLDTQGSEHLILQGAEKMLSSGNILLIFTEVSFEKLYKNQSLFFDLHTLLSSYQYQLFNIFNLIPDAKLKLLSGDAIFLSPRLIKKLSNNLSED